MILRSNAQPPFYHVIQMSIMQPRPDKRVALSDMESIAWSEYLYLSRTPVRIYYVVMVKFKFRVQIAFFLSQSVL